MGRASPIGSGPPQIEPRGSSEPIENSPPGIQTIPAGAMPGGLAEFSTVGKNRLLTPAVARSHSAPVSFLPAELEPAPACARGAGLFHSVVKTYVTRNAP